MKIPQPTEHQEQASLFKEAAIRAKTDPRWSMMFAIPNGGKRSIITASLLKAEGVKAGTPDIFLPVPVGNWCGMFIEMKVRKGGQVSTEQRAFFADLDARYRLVVAHGAEHASKAIAEYLDGKS